MRQFRTDTAVIIFAICSVLLTLLLGFDLLFTKASRQELFVTMFFDGLAICGLVYTTLVMRRSLKRLQSSVDLSLRSLAEQATDSTTGVAYGDPAHAIESASAKASALVAESRRKERLLLEKAIDVVCVLDLNAQFISVSKASRRAWGYSPNELIGCPVASFLDQKSASRIMELVGNATGTIDKVAFESKFKRKDGSEIDVAWTGHWSATECGLYCIVHDITAHKLKEQGIRQSEQKLRMALEALPVGILAIDTIGMVEFANRGAHTMLGYQAGQMVGSSVSSMIDSDIAVEPTAQDGTKINTIATCKDGTLMPIELWRGNIDLSDEPKVLLVFLDKSSEIELEKVKSEFLAMVSHDVRNPLTSIQGLLGLLEQGAIGEISPQGQQLANRAHKECARILRLLNDMLQMESMEQGAFQLEWAEFDLAATVAEAIESVRPLAEARQLTFEVALDKTACFADEQRITQVLVNLLTNAVKFSPDGARIAVSLNDLVEAVLVTVRDQGRGIPADRLDKVFAKFEQVQAADAREKGGTGLGLAICKAIIEQHGGQIGVDSDVGQGSRFWFVLPRR